MDALQNDLDALQINNHNQGINKKRKEQIGSGQRGDKIRTYRFQEDCVIDHQSGKKAPISKILKGNFQLLWK